MASVAGGALRPVHSGKVRDVYDAGDGLLLMVASDRISAFDVVMAETIPGKGRVLTAMTVWWLQELADLAPNHLVSWEVADFPPGAAAIRPGGGADGAAGVTRSDGAAGVTRADGGSWLAGRSMLVRRAEMLPIECIVRGYLSGSAWKEYRERGTVHGMTLPAGLAEADRLSEPLFTPSTKATEGHDLNISFDEAGDLVGRDTAVRARELCVGAFARSAALAAERGIIVADTKFELGWIDGELALCDEVLTPDSSRLWPTGEWKPGATPQSFDKQPVRDWLEASGWDKRPPPPRLPEEVVASTARRYREAYERITSLRLDEWPGGGEGAGAGQVAPGMRPGGPQRKAGT